MTFTLRESLGPPAPFAQVRVKVVVWVRPLTWTEPLLPPLALKPLSPVMLQLVVLLVCHVRVLLPAEGEPLPAGPMVDGVG